MTISEGISQIIEKRNAKVPALKEKMSHLQNILSQIQNIDSIRDRMLADAEKLKMSADVKTSIQSINTMNFEHAMEQLIKFYSDTISRFERHEINIAVVGSARQGKSQLLQSISNLDDSVIPAFANNDCTGASSVIKNVPGSTLKADISFRDEFEMAATVQAYLDEIFGGGSMRLESFEGIKRLSVAELEGKINRGSAEKTKFDHLRKYIEHFDEWKELVHKGHITVYDPNEIQKYVAQHNGENENSPQRRNYYYYLAVKEATISCEFNNPETGSIVLRDTIGLGDTSLGIKEKMLETISVHSDAAIIVRRPETGTGKFDETDERLYKELNNAFAKRNMDKWLFWLINRTTVNSIYGDNLERCKAFQSKLDSYEWSIAESRIVDVADKDAVNNEFLPSVLEILIENIDAVDAGIMVEIEGLADRAYSELRAIQDAVKNILIQGATGIVDTADFLDNKWYGLYDKGLMKLLKDYRDELFDKRDEECVDFKDKVIEILKKSTDLIPSEETLSDQLQQGGRSRGIDVYTVRMDKLRTEFTKEFIDTDEEIFDSQTTAFKSKVVEILTSDKGGRLGHLIPLSDFDTPDEWLSVFAKKYFSMPRYGELKLAFEMLAEFSLTVRGFLMHRIRSRIDLLDPKKYDGEDDMSYDDEAKKIRLTMNRKLKDVREELFHKFQDELFREPNRIFYAIISEFYDRINFSYQPNMKDAENMINAEMTWRQFYRDHVGAIWSNEFQEEMKLSELYKDWSELSVSLSKITKQDFTNNI